MSGGLFRGNFTGDLGYTKFWKALELLDNALELGVTISYEALLFGLLLSAFNCTSWVDFNGPDSSSTLWLLILALDKTVTEGAESELNPRLEAELIGLVAGGSRSYYHPTSIDFQNKRINMREICP